MLEHMENIICRTSMTRKDSEKESERPHYYSQFWLDIAAGRRTIGGPKPEDEGEFFDDSSEAITLHEFQNEPDEDLDEVDDRVNGRTTTTRSVVEPVISTDEVDEASEPDEIPIATDEVEDLPQDEAVADADIPDMDFVADEAPEDEDEDEELFEDEDEDEDEDEEGWVAGRGRKKPSVKRPTKQPPVKRPKRDSRRSF